MKAARNSGLVHVVQERQSLELLAVKEMPKTWTGNCHEEFVKMHPKESEHPWTDLGCMHFLNSVNYKYACHLHGVYQSNAHTFIVSSLATEGDLFQYAGKGEPPGRKRELELSPLVVQLCHALQLLHGYQIAHRDISLENIVLTIGKGGALQLLLIDFGMAAVGQKFQGCEYGKPSYIAPEMHADGVYDAFLSDTFAAGVVVYALFWKDYPWTSTSACKCWAYVRRHGLKKYCERRCLESTRKELTSCISDAFMQVMEGLLHWDPESRLTLGEKEFCNRRSVWDENWFRAAGEP
jgi:serine/threonine protein kinase